VAGILVGIATELQTGWYGGRIRLGARFSAPVQTGRVVQTASYTMGTESFPGANSSQGVMLTPIYF
jgi:hypothetical protein